MTDEPTNDDLRLVAEHGSGSFIRALAVAQLAYRNDAVEDVEDWIDENTDDPKRGATA